MYFINSKLDALFNGFDVIVFDLNGLLVDDEAIQLRATNTALAAYGVKITENNWIEQCVGHKPSEYLPSVLPGASSSDVAQLIRNKDIAYATLIEGRVKEMARPGAMSLLEYLTDSNKILAVATSTTKTGTRAILGESGLNIWHNFALIVTGDEVERAKPNPEIYLKVRSMLGNTLTYLALEDSASGVVSAKAAAMTCVAVPSRFTDSQDFCCADIIVTSLERDASIR
jgi:HAD superfamily hydrolase (TIGR01509 family)